MVVKVGCCGWAVRGGRKAYFKAFKLIEVQSTFYKLPRLQTAKTWREEAPPGFEFNAKAWQTITHPPSSPTWRKAGLTVPKSRASRYGGLKPTEENFEAWGKTKEICDVLKAKVCVLQCPASFQWSSENTKNIRDFMNTIDRRGLEVGWEPRGDWRQHGDEVAKICDELRLTHVVDVFRWKPLSKHRLGYIRLHGIGRGEVNYRYEYSDEDLRRLLGWMAELEPNREAVYVLFNNLSMADDSARFLRMLHGVRD